MDFDKYRKINDEKMNIREMEDADVVFHYKNESCGDDYQVFLKTESDRVTDASFTTTGCGFGLASLAIATELIKGKTLDEAEKITPEQIEAYIDGFPPRRRRYPETGAEVIRLAIGKAREKLAAAPS